MGIYSAYIAITNIPNSDSGGLFIASYVICIIQSIIYIIGSICIPVILLNNNDDQTLNRKESFVPIILDMYWLFIYFNYSVSDKYDEYALVKISEVFMIIGLTILSCCGICIVIFRDNSKLVVIVPDNL
jgi:hypothetical protein